jgi:hypothetical protein
MRCAIIRTADQRAILADTITNWAFGPIFDSTEESRACLTWLARDPRDIMLEAILSSREPNSVLETHYHAWCAQRAHSSPTPIKAPSHA